MIIPSLLAAMVLNGSVFCESTNKDFDGYRQNTADTETFPHCKRNVSSNTKTKVYKNYGIIGDHSAYCIDHGVSLFAGGSNNIDNLWPNLKDENGQCEKQGLETEVESKLKNGDITTKEAQDILMDYVTKRKQELFGN
jgi:hypothetical protein